MDVAHQFEQITVRIDQQGFVSPLEKMAGFFVSAIKVLRIAKAEVLHDPGQGYFADLDGEVQMVGHQAECMDAMAEPHGALLQQKVEPAAIRRIGEDNLPVIAAENDMIEGAGEMDSGFSGHGEILK